MPDGARVYVVTPSEEEWLRGMVFVGVRLCPNPTEAAQYLADVLRLQVREPKAEG